MSATEVREVPPAAESTEGDEVDSSSQEDDSSSSLSYCVTCSDFKRMKPNTITNKLKMMTPVSFVLKKMSRRNFAFIYFDTVEAMAAFMRDVNGQVVDRDVIRVSIPRRGKRPPRPPPHKREPDFSSDEKVPYAPRRGDSWAREESLKKLPSLQSLKSKRLSRPENETVSDKTAPLIRLSYVKQLAIKNEYFESILESIASGVRDEVGVDVTDSDSTAAGSNGRRGRPKKARYNNVLLADRPTDESAAKKVPRWCQSGGGKTPCPVEPTCASPIKVGYRNKCEFTIGFSDSDMREIECGFVTRLSGFEPIVESSSGCIHVPLAMQEVCHRMKMALKEHRNDLPVYNRSRQRGIWRLMKIRFSETRNEMMVVLLIKPFDKIAEVLAAKGEAKGVSAIAASLREKVVRFIEDELVYTKPSATESTGEQKKQIPYLYNDSKIVSVFLQEREEVSDAFDDAAPLIQVYGDSPFITMDLMGLQFQVGPSTFFQTNRTACEVLYSKIAELLVASQSDLVLDICCGAGTISQCLYKALLGREQVPAGQTPQRAALPQFIGIELVDEAVGAAENNARLNFPEEAAPVKLNYFAGKVEDVLSGILAAFIEPEHKHVTAVVDPPRSGLHPSVLRTLLYTSPIDEIIYVSCNPLALVEDAISLCSTVQSEAIAMPFKPVKAVGVDMFPHTAHAELILHLKRVTADDFE